MQKPGALRALQCNIYFSHGVFGSEVRGFRAAVLRVLGASAGPDTVRFQGRMSFNKGKQMLDSAQGDVNQLIEAIHKLNTAKELYHPPDDMRVHAGLPRHLHVSALVFACCPGSNLISPGFFMRAVLALSVWHRDSTTAWRCSR